MRRKLSAEEQRLLDLFASAKKKRKNKGPRCSKCGAPTIATKFRSPDGRVLRSCKNCAHAFLSRCGQ